MKLQNFREVVAVAEHGIRAPARALGVAQPGLTRSLAQLEQQLGNPLFERRARGVVPTTLLHSDLLAMVPVQWTEVALTRDLLTTVSVTEELSALPIVAVSRADLPLTPAATHLLDLLKRGKVLKTAIRPTGRRRGKVA